MNLMEDRAGSSQKGGRVRQGRGLEGTKELTFQPGLRNIITFAVIIKIQKQNLYTSFAAHPVVGSNSRLTCVFAHLMLLLLIHLRRHTYAQAYLMMLQATADRPPAMVVQPGLLYKALSSPVMLHRNRASQAQ